MDSPEPRPLRVVVVGQVPPPTGGQALMTRILLDGRYEGVQLIHVPMQLSDSLDDMGRAGLGKFIGLLGVIRRIIRVRRQLEPDVLYYVPAPPALAPVLRDLILLNVVRSRFKRTIFHFHAGGVSRFEDQLPRPLRALFRRAYRRPDVAILTAHGAPDDGAGLGARHTRIVPNGIPDPFPAPEKRAPTPSGTPRLLYVGLISREKGIDTLLEACRDLVRSEYDFELHLVGPFSDSALRREVEEAGATGKLANRIRIHGAVEGDAKWTYFADAAVFCFPSAHPSETFGVAIVEAFACGRPVVATRRRGAPEIIGHGENGLLFDAGNATELARCLGTLLATPDLAFRMGQNARSTYEREFTEACFHTAMQKVFDALGDGASVPREIEGAS